MTLLTIISWIWCVAWPVWATMNVKNTIKTDPAVRVLPPLLRGQVKRIIILEKIISVRTGLWLLALIRVIHSLIWQ